MWANAALYSCSGHWSLINQPFFYSGTKTRSPDYLLRTSAHLLLGTLISASTPAGSGSPLLPNPATRGGPCSNSSVLCDVRDAWLPNIEMDHKCPYVSMACISRKTVTHLISHSQKLEAGPWWSFIKRNLLPAQADTGTDDGQGGILAGVIYVEAFKSLLNCFSAR